MRVPSVPGLSTMFDRVDVVKVVDTLDKATNAAAIEVKRLSQKLRPTVIVAYRGWYADGIAHMTARAIERPVFAAGDGSPGLRESFRANLRRFTVLTISDVTVTASAGDVSQEVTSDADGYLTVALPVGELSAGWHVVDFDPIEGGVEVEHATGRFFVPDPAGGTAVISDIDDTILKTGLTQRFTTPMVRTFFRDVGRRKPIRGMAPLYAGLVRGADGHGAVPFFYVSTGTWNLYDYLVSFLNLHRFPRGPLFLTDWGPNQERLMRDGKEHKRSSIRGLIQANPTYEWVLIGDVGQGDPETYEAMAREFPGRVTAVFLIYVGSHLPERTAEIAERARALREEDIPMYYVANALEAAMKAAALGLVDEATVTAVAEDLADRS